MNSLLVPTDWNVSLQMTNSGDIFIQFESKTTGNLFSWKVSPDSAEGRHFLSWVQTEYPETITDMSYREWR